MRGHYLLFFIFAIGFVESRHLRHHNRHYDYDDILSDENLRSLMKHHFSRFQDEDDFDGDDYDENGNEEQTTPIVPTEKPTTEQPTLPPQTEQPKTTPSNEIIPSQGPTNPQMPDVNVVKELMKTGAYLRYLKRESEMLERSITSMRKHMTDNFGQVRRYIKMLQQEIDTLAASRSSGTSSRGRGYGNQYGGRSSGGRKITGRHIVDFVNKLLNGKKKDEERSHKQH